MPDEKNVRTLPVVKYLFPLNSQPKEGEAPKLLSLRMAIDEKCGTFFIRSIRMKDYNGRRFMDGSVYTCSSFTVHVDSEDGIPLDDDVQPVIWGAKKKTPIV